VLFLDELPEFQRSVLEVMRQPLEDRVITISRAKFTVEYPASFMLISSMNPCPCGYYNHPEKECVCAPANRSLSENLKQPEVRHSDSYLLLKIVTISIFISKLQA